MKIAMTLFFCWFFASTAYADQAWRHTCEALKDLPVPAASATAPKGCSSERLYYGIGAPADYTTARTCALAEQGSNEPVFGGSAILMMIYANGFGVARNLNLAMHFACLLDGAPAEMSARISHLQRLKASHGNGQNFDLCDDITSGFMSGHCAAHQARMKDATRSLRLAKIAAAVPAKNQRDFAALQQASAEFIKARADNEVDMSGTARSAYVVEETEVLREDYVQMLEAYAAGKEHKHSNAQFEEREATLAKLLAQIEKASPKAQALWGTVRADGIMKTQRAWEGYRDAFARYAANRYAGTREESVKAWLTAKRIHMLKSFAPAR